MKSLVRALAALTLIVVAVWAGAVGFLWANESRFVYRTSWTRGSMGLDASFTPIRLASSDDLELEAVTLEHDRTGVEQDRFWIIYFNGAAGSIYRRRYQQQLRQLHDAGYNVLSLDYRGFGRNSGTPSERGLYADGHAAYRYLTRDRHVRGSRVILAGRSLGSAVAVELATGVTSAGVLLLSPIDSVPLVGARLYPWAPVRLLATNQFDSLDKIERIRVPLLIVHAVNDRFVPIDAGRALYGKARHPKLMLETSGGHNSAGFSPFAELAGALQHFWPTERATDN